MTFFAHPTSVIDDDAAIGSGTKIWHFCHIATGAIIGKECTLGQNAFVSGRARIGDHVKIQNNVSVYDGVVLENYVFCGPSMVFTNDINPRSRYPKHGNFLQTIVKEGASIGANATVVCGITIGRHAFIGSGAVVTKDIPDYALAYGIPAKVYGWVCECGQKLEFSEDATTCTSCHKRYNLTDNILKPQ